MNAFKLPKIHSSLLVSFLTLMIFVNANQITLAVNKISSDQLHSDVLYGELSHNELVDNLETLGIKCILHEGTAKALVVDKVHLGSSAYYRGILKGDVVKDLHKLSVNTFNLVIERSGKSYQINLETALNHTNLSAQTTKIALAPAVPKIMIPSSVSKQESSPIKKLLPYDIELIIDVSGSMGFVDGTGNLTKFQWCYEQIHDLAQRLDPYRKAMTITTFNTSHETGVSHTSDKIEQIYASAEPVGGTNLVEPLMDRLNNSLSRYKATSRPVLIVVITDGLPNVPRDPQAVNRALIDFTQKLDNPNEVVITILQIGDTFAGRDFCVDLDENLVSEGAKYDIVDTKTFFELKHDGLVSAMVDAVVNAPDRQLSKHERHFKQFMTNLSPPNQTVSKYDYELKKRQSERQAIERQNLNQ